MLRPDLRGTGLSLLRKSSSSTTILLFFTTHGPRVCVYPQVQTSIPKSLPFLTPSLSSSPSTGGTFIHQPWVSTLPLSPRRTRSPWTGEIPSGETLLGRSPPLPVLLDWWLLVPVVPVHYRGIPFTSRSVRLRRLPTEIRPPPGTSTISVSGSVHSWVKFVSAPLEVLCAPSYVMGKWDLRIYGDLSFPPVRWSLLPKSRYYHFGGNVFTIVTRRHWVVGRTERKKLIGTRKPGSIEILCKSDIKCTIIRRRFWVDENISVTLR